RIAALITCAFRVKADHVTGAFATNLRQASKRIFVELALFDQWFIAAGKERRIHRPPTHDQIHQHPSRGLIEEPAAHRKEKLFAEACAIKQNARDCEEIKKRTM